MKPFFSNPRLYGLSFVGFLIIATVVGLVML